MWIGSLRHLKGGQHRSELRTRAGRGWPEVADRGASMLEYVSRERDSRGRQPNR